MKFYKHPTTGENLQEFAARFAKENPPKEVPTKELKHNDVFYIRNKWEVFKGSITSETLPNIHGDNAGSVNTEMLYKESYLVLCSYRDLISYFEVMKKTYKPFKFKIELVGEKGETALWTHVQTEDKGKEYARSAMHFAVDKILNAHYD